MPHTGVTKYMEVPPPRIETILPPIPPPPAAGGAGAAVLEGILDGVDVNAAKPPELGGTGFAAGAG